MIDPPQLTSENVAAWSAALATLGYSGDWLASMYLRNQPHIVQREFGTLWYSLRLEQQEALMVEFATRRLTE